MSLRSPMGKRTEWNHRVALWLRKFWFNRELNSNPILTSHVSSIMPGGSTFSESPDFSATSPTSEESPRGSTAGSSRGSVVGDRGEERKRSRSQRSLNRQKASPQRKASWSTAVPSMVIDEEAEVPGAVAAWRRLVVARMARPYVKWQRLSLPLLLRCGRRGAVTVSLDAARHLLLRALREV